MNRLALLIFAGVLWLAPVAHADLISVIGPNSSAGAAPLIIPAPSDILDDFVTNTAMQGFNEAQGVFTTVPHAIDGGGAIPAGTLVNSHMVFLNSAGTTAISHVNVLWTFDGPILGVMSNAAGTLEAASTFELGNPLTNYTLTSPPGSGPAAPFANRGLEGADSYVVSLNQITVNMAVTEPGDWIRVVTAAPVTPIPGPGYGVVVVLGLLGYAIRRARAARVRL
jgi:hypothetical protein